MFEFLKKDKKEVSKLTIDKVSSSNYIAVTFDESHACEGVVDIQYFIATGAVNVNRAIILLVTRLTEMVDSGEVSEKDVQEIIRESIAITGSKN